MSQRKIEYLNDNRIIYKRDPINDEPTYSNEYYSYYEDGTHEHYYLFNSNSKITSYKSLKWHALVLSYLNRYSKLEHAKIIRFICNKNNGFITWKVDETSISNIIKNTFWKGVYVPKNRLRKIIFKDFCPLSFDEKMKIVGELVGKQKVIYEEDIYQCMIDLNELNKKITWDKVAKLLNCSTRTIHRNINKELKTEKIILNEKI
jgi:hypothetical protein|tara:strand:+ start:139 stop:750 length:612 start_codon:yes stop_codon:yes gene_type:complete